MRRQSVLIVREAHHDQNENDRGNHDDGTVGSSHRAIDPALRPRSQAQPASSLVITAEVRFGYALIAGGEAIALLPPFADTDYECQQRVLPVSSDFSNPLASSAPLIVYIDYKS